jgi:hypothetical protein
MSDRQARPVVSAVVPHRNSGLLLERCVSALLSSSSELEEIVVADEASSDGSVERVKALPRVRVVESPRRGFAAAINTGVQATAAGRLLLLNSDAFVRPDTIERLGRRLDEDPALAICGASLVDEHGARAKTHTFLFTFWRALVDTLNIRPPLAQEGHGLTYTEAVLPTCALVRRDAFDEVGGFDERFLFYYEDLDFSLRIARAGWKQAIDWEAEAVHVGGGSTSQRAPQRWYIQFHRSRLIYLRKHYPGVWPIYALLWAVKATVHVARWTFDAWIARLRGDRAREEFAREWAAAARASVWPGGRPWAR